MDLLYHHHHYPYHHRDSDRYTSKLCNGEVNLTNKFHRWLRVILAVKATTITIQHPSLLRNQPPVQHSVQQLRDDHDAHSSVILIPLTILLVRFRNWRLASLFPFIYFHWRNLLATFIFRRIFCIGSWLTCSADIMNEFMFFCTILSKLRKVSMRMGGVRPRARFKPWTPTTTSNLATLGCLQ